MNPERSIPPQQVEKKYKMGFEVKPLFSQEEELKAVAHFFHLPDQLPDVEQLSTTTDILQVLFTPQQQKRLALWLSEKDAKSQVDKLANKTFNFFGRSEKRAWQPQDISLVQAVEAKLARMFGAANVSPELVKLFAEAVMETLSEEAEDASTFKLKNELIHQNYIDADNTNFMGALGEFIRDVATVFKKSAGGALKVASLRQLLQSVKAHPNNLPKPRGIDYSFSYELHNLADKMETMGKALQEPGLSDTDHDELKAQLKAVIKEHTSRIIAGRYDA